MCSGFLSAWLLALCSLLLAPRSVHAWGEQEHEIIADIAQTMLSNNVLTKVQNILHAYWDGHMVTVVGTNASDHQMWQILTNGVAKNANKWKDTGDYHDWPAAWATDSAREANGVYWGVKIGPAVFKIDNTPQQIQINAPNGPDSNYDKRQRDRVTRQLAKGAFHPAELLNRLNWQ